MSELQKYMFYYGKVNIYNPVCKVEICGLMLWHILCLKLHSKFEIYFYSNTVLSLNSLKISCNSCKEFQ